MKNFFIPEVNEFTPLEMATATFIEITKSVGPTEKRILNKVIDTITHLSFEVEETQFIKFILMYESVNAPDNLTVDQMDKIVERGKIVYNELFNAKQLYKTQNN